jgi:hypothetical protein
LVHWYISHIVLVFVVSVKGRERYGLGIGMGAQGEVRCTFGGLDRDLGP